jgi:hypothetical protein
MLNVKVSALASRVSTGLPDRWSGFAANPVGGTAAVTRARAPLAANAPARVQHPKLNTTPWSTSYAQKRQPVPARKSKGMRAG